MTDIRPDDAARRDADETPATDETPAAADERAPGGTPATADNFRVAGASATVGSVGSVESTEPVGSAEPAAGMPAVATPPQYGVGPFSVREVVLGAVWVVAFVLSFLSTVDFTFSSVWTQGIAWVLPVGVPTIAVFLVALRRLSPTGIRRVGSLGIDQFASVAFSVSTVVWLSDVWSQVQVSIAGGRWSLSWMPWAQLVLMAGGVALTVVAPIIPGLSEDFRRRPPAPAHRNARPVRPITARPRPIVLPVTGGAHTDQRGADVNGAPAVTAPAVAGRDTPTTVIPADAFAPPDAVGHAEAHDDAVVPDTVQAFWALVPDERDVVDESGTVLFRIGPSAWALAIEDRGDAFVIRHEDGRMGLLRDVSGVTRG